MICETCKTEGKTSRIFEGASWKTAMNCRPFYDEHGKRHVHDSNRVTTSYRCSNGHAWERETRGSCWCGWPRPEPVSEETT